MDYLLSRENNIECRVLLNSSKVGLDQLNVNSFSSQLIINETEQKMNLLRQIDAVQSSF